VTLAQGAPRRSSTVARISAIARRDATIEFSYQFNLALRVSQVVLVSTSLYFVSKLVDDAEELRPYGGDYFGFAVIGFMVVSFATLGLVAFNRSVSDELRQGTLELLLTSPTRSATLLAGAMVVPALITLFQVVVYVAVAVGIYGLRFPPEGLLLAVPILVLTFLTFAAFGIMSAAVVVLTKRGDPVTAFGAQITTFLAGTLFPVALLPGPLQAFVKVVPAYYGLEGTREALLGGAGVGDVAPEAAILLVVAILLLPLSMAVFGWALRQARITGTLGTY
jgi:ABC-2 type transport system permease protein